MRAWASYVVRQLSALHSALYFGADVAFNPSRDTKKQTQKELKKKAFKQLREQSELRSQASESKKVRKTSKKLAKRSRCIAIAMKKEVSMQTTSRGR